MKKLCCIILALCLTACGVVPEASGSSKVIPSTARLNDEMKGSTNKTEGSEEITIKRKDKMEELLAELQEKIDSEQKAEKPRIIQMEKTLMENYEWSTDYDAMLVDSIRTYVTLNEDEKETYPQLAQVLDELGRSMEKSQREEMEKFIQYSEQDIANMPEYFQTYVDRQDVQVRRADSKVVSLAVIDITDFAGMGAYRTIYGLNYDSNSGEQLQLSDVITDKDAFVCAVEEELQGGMWSGELYSENAVYLFFENNMEEEISWTLDYNGVTVYFNPNDVAEKEYGNLIATVSFAEYPQLFREQYKDVPDSYMVELGKNMPFFTDLDNDNNVDELIVAGLIDDGMEYYSQIGIYTAKSCYEQEFMGYRIIPYYVKTAEGEQFIYLTCCSMFLGDFCVYSINGGEICDIGELDACLHMVEYDENIHRFSLLTDPAKMYLDDYNDPARIYGLDHYGVFREQDGVVFETAANGLPRRWDKMMPDVDQLELTPLSMEELVGTHNAYFSLNPHVGQPHFHPWIDPKNDDVESAALIIREDGSGSIIDFDNMEEELSFKWYVDSIHVYRLESELGGTFYLSSYSGEKLGSPERWLFLCRESDGYQLWFCE